VRRGGRRLGSRRAGPVWQIIYMDLMTIMMVFFVILWSVERKDAEAEGIGVSMTIGDQTVRMVHLPGDVLFASGRTELGAEGREVFARLFGDDPGAVLSFDQGGVARRRLVVHGHTDAVGDKDENFRLGYERAFSVYQEIRKYGAEVPDNVVICTHADNSPAQAVPVIAGPLSAEQRQALREAHGKNRRITIEDQLLGERRDGE
jgi:flagellar motor protein MotB